MIKQASLFVLFFCFFLGINQFSFAEDKIYSLVTSGEQLATPSGAKVLYNDEIFNSDGLVLTGWGDRLSIKSNESLIYLEVLPYGIDPVTIYFQAEVELEVRYKSYSDEWLPSQRITLVVNYDPEEGTSYRDKELFVLGDGHFVEWKAVSPIKFVDRSGAEIENAELFSKVQLHTEIRVNRYFVVDVNERPSGVKSALDYTVNSNPSAFSAVRGERDLGSGNLYIQWNAVGWAEYYELEYTFINSYSSEQVETPYSQRLLTELFYDFKNNSTRIQLEDTLYSLPWIFEQGVLLWRVRGVGKGGEKFQQPIPGAWSAYQNHAGRFRPVDGHYVQTLVTATPYMHEKDSKNWQHIATFSEGGKRKDVVTYFDGVMRERQSVTRLNSNNVLLGAETIYDHQGRPAVDVLPSPKIFESPIDRQPFIAYQQDFTTNPSGIPYTFRDFEDMSLNGRALPLNQRKDGAGRYFSSYNPDQKGHQGHLPDAQGYPFAHREYVDDNTGRIARQGGVGPHHQLGSGHEEKYYYSVPSQDELDRIFGNEAGYAQHYDRITRIDANGQGYVEYRDSRGNLIATALTGPSPESLMPLESLESVETTHDLLEKEQDYFTTQSLRSSKSIYVSQDSSVYQFQYQLDPSDFEDDACQARPVCYDCVYDLSLQIRDQIGNLVYEKADRIGSLREVSVCDGDAEPYVVEFQAELNRGTYWVNKSLKINDEAIDTYVENYLNEEANSCISNWRWQLELGLRDEIENAPCERPCVLCDIDTGTESLIVEFDDGSTETVTFNTETRKELGEACTLNCLSNIEISSCHIGLEAILTDLQPGGQYALYEPNTNSYLLSVLNDNNKLPFKGQSWKNPIGGYRSADGSLSRVEVSKEEACEIPESEGDFIICAPENLVEVEDFIEAWEPSWAEALKYYHPEYGYYAWCMENNNAFALDDRMRAVTNFYEAESEGFLMPISLDPFFEDEDRGEKMGDRLAKIKVGDDDFTIVELVNLIVNCNNRSIEEEELD